MAVVATMNSSDVDEKKKKIVVEEEVDGDEEEEEEEAVVMTCTMKQQEQQQQVGGNHPAEEETVMPGFRFHPTEEELVEFYLRRKVEGKRFQVELITFLDLYRYDPWQLPAMAAIGEKEWFFYVPRDRKYRNGDRPNRVTTSGYWKATGADRLIRTENFRSIGLKKTLVFYSGKAPKGIRTSWIMNEYRLPQHETQRHQKAEISLCRVYKRAGVEEHHPHSQLPRLLPSRSSPPLSSGGTTSTQHQHTSHPKNPKPQRQHASSSRPPTHHYYGCGLPSQMTPNMEQMSGTATAADSVTLTPFQLAPYFAAATRSAGSSSSSSSSDTSLHLLDDDLQRVVNYQQQAAAASSLMMNIHHFHHQQHQLFSGCPLPPPPPPPLPQQLQSLPAPLSTTASSSRLLWDWNQAAGDHTHRSPSSSDYTTRPPFK